MEIKTGWIKVKKGTDSSFYELMLPFIKSARFMFRHVMWVFFVLLRGLWISMKGSWAPKIQYGSFSLSGHIWHSFFCQETNLPLFNWMRANSKSFLSEIMGFANFSSKALAEISENFDSY